MNLVKVYVNPGVFEFEIEDNASYDEVELMAWKELYSNIIWYWETENKQ